MSAFHGNFFTRSTDLLSLPTVPIDQSYVIELQIEDPLTQPFVVLQTAVLHTTCYGERRIRVTTTAYPTTTSMSEIFASADQNAIMTLLANKAVERAMSAKLEDARDAVINKVVDILKVYKDSMTSAGSGASAQLTVPDNLKLMPLLACAMIKHVSSSFACLCYAELRLIRAVLSISRSDSGRVLRSHLISELMRTHCSALYQLNR
jgi:protein transport protein SEC24